MRRRLVGGLVDGGGGARGNSEATAAGGRRSQGGHVLPCDFGTRRPSAIVFDELILFGQIQMNLPSSILPARCCGHVIFVFGSGAAGM